MKLTKKKYKEHLSGVFSRKPLAVQSAMARAVFYENTHATMLLFYFLYTIRLGYLIENRETYYRLDAKHHKGGGF